MLMNCRVLHMFAHTPEYLGTATALRDADLTEAARNLDVPTYVLLATGTVHLT